MSCHIHLDQISDFYRRQKFLKSCFYSLCSGEAEALVPSESLHDILHQATQQEHDGGASTISAQCDNINNELGRLAKHHIKLINFVFFSHQNLIEIFTKLIHVNFKIGSFYCFIMLKKQIK